MTSQNAMQETFKSQGVLSKELYRIICMNKQLCVGFNQRSRTDGKKERLRKKQKNEIKERKRKRKKKLKKGKGDKRKERKEGRPIIKLLNSLPVS